MFFILGFRYRGSDIMVSDFGFPVDTEIMVSNTKFPKMGFHNWKTYSRYLICCCYVVGMLLICCCYVVVMLLLCY